MRISDWSSDVCSSDLRYSWRNKVEQLRIEPISQASANQRAGRCGRIGPGVCVRLYAEDDFKARAPFTDPEVLRSSLASVILRSEEHTSELQSLMRISYAVFCLKKKNTTT